MPRNGFTGELWRPMKIANMGTLSRLVLFTGPHGSVAPVKDYESVVMVANGSGIVAQLPYLKQLVHHHNNHKARTSCEIKQRTIHMFNNRFSATNMFLGIKFLITDRFLITNRFLITSS